MVTSVVGLCLALFLGGIQPSSPLELLGKLDRHDLPEASGIVKSRRHAGIFWTHNDSGNPPHLYAIRRDGKIVRRYKLDLANVDWEDIDIDDEGRLYLGDIGNNGGHLPIRAIYRIAEPDPTQPVESPLKPINAWFYAFPQDRRFDAESLIIDRGRAILVSKTFGGREAEVYSLSLDRPATFFKPVIPTRVGVLPGFREAATGGTLSADGERLAVCSATASRIYKRNKSVVDQSWELDAEVDYPACEVEAICWDGQDLILAGEDQKVFRLSEMAWRNRVRGNTPKPHRN